MLQRMSFLTETEQRALTDFITHLQAMYPSDILDVRLFGSKVRGNADAESDIDLLIIVAGEEMPLRRTVARLGSKIDLKYGVVLSELIMSQMRFEWHRRHRAPLYRALAHESVSLWTNTLGNEGDIE